MPENKEINEFAYSLTKLGYDIYDMTDNYTVIMMNKHKEFLKKNN